MELNRKEEEEEEEEEERRACNKAHRSNWKQKLRANCCKRVREDRSRLLWKFRTLETHRDDDDNKQVMDFTFRDIVSDELNKIKKSGDHDIWLYDDHHHLQNKTNWEEIMIEMERIFYQDLRLEQTASEQAKYGEPWEDEDDYLEAALEQLQLNNGEISKEEVWCPICKRGELREDHRLISCTRCKLQLNRGDEVNLGVLRIRLAEVYTDHLERGCRLAPSCCLETRFSLTALYIKCEACNTFEIVL